jgi:hypothetical protein
VSVAIFTLSQESIPLLETICTNIIIPKSRKIVSNSIDSIASSGDKIPKRTIKIAPERAIIDLSNGSNAISTKAIPNMRNVRMLPKERIKSMRKTAAHYTSQIIL